ncbi:Biphenyl-2,3-diol 1,2-dioxygenase 3 [Pseudocercospora fuligena]|uniref:Biphenyl-2,3-diol 1,2-dioxygenase 3 n=1 Tax=Pseudocercospora fuligena TaxID=685502 RepID=A0A8H6RUY2_9PEZI|nr:Biphenyl-2,3-diol 1,2-dioxygenase 3 [Pseudocercospora fuligena]
MATTFDNPGKTVIKPSKLAHLVLRTNNMQKLSNFYRTFLSATITFQNDFMILLSYDSEHHRLGIIQIPNLSPKDTSTCGLEHIAFTFDSITDLAMSYLQRKEHGIVPFWCINHGPTTSAYYKDPDGNIVECQVENFVTVQEAQEFMEGEEYAKNPLGVDFEMEELIERIRGGESEEELKRRPESGPRSIDSVPS